MGIVNNQGSGDSNQKESAIVSEESAIVSEESAIVSLIKFKEVVEGYQTRYGENPINCASYCKSENTESAGETNNYSFDCRYHSQGEDLFGSEREYTKRNDTSNMLALLQHNPLSDSKQPNPPSDPKPSNTFTRRFKRKPNKGGKRVKCKTKKKRKTKKKGRLVPKKKRRTKRKK